MKVVSLNIWGGHVWQPLVNFFETHQDVDVFCLQEVYHDAPALITQETRYVNLQGFAEISALLPDHTGYFCPLVDDIFGLAIFVRREYEVSSIADKIIHYNPNYLRIKPDHTRKLQAVSLMLDGEITTVINVHGLWNGNGKTDTDARIKQSLLIKEFMSDLNHPAVLCGDFNLCPNTDSLALLEDNMINLVKTHDITSTRSSYYPKLERMADYMLISPEIDYNEFSVLVDEVSDHLALYLDVDITRP